MHAFSFTTASNEGWAHKIRSGLWKECESLTGLLKDSPAFSIYATHNDQFVGGALLQHFGEILWLDALWVHPDLRGQGLGKQLLHEVVTLAYMKQVREVQLNTYFEKAHQFFLSCGFVEVACIPKWKYDVSCHLMRKSLLS